MFSLTLSTRSHLQIKGFPGALEIIENHKKNQCMEFEKRLKTMEKIMNFCELI